MAAQRPDIVARTREFSGDQLGRPASQSGGGSGYTEAELESWIDWIAEVIAEERLNEIQGGSLSTTPSKIQEDSNEYYATSQ